MEFCGETYRVHRGGTVTVGREGDVLIDDNPFLHRHFLAISHTDDGLCLLSNVGSRLHATACDADGRMEAYVAPGVTVPLVFPTTRVAFAAGSTSYELLVRSDGPVSFSPAVLPLEAVEARSGETTLGPANLTPDQRRLLVALAEHRLIGDASQGATIPPSAAVAARLGWPITKFNRKLDNVCSKLDRLGVQGLLGRPGEPASNRRARLVEYSLGTGLVTTDHLALLRPAGQEGE